MKTKSELIQELKEITAEAALCCASGRAAIRAWGRRLWKRARALEDQVEEIEREEGRQLNLGL